MKTQEHNTLFIHQDFSKVIEHRDMCKLNAEALIKHNKNLMFIDTIEKINNYYVLIFKIVPKNRYTVKEYNRMKEIVNEYFWNDYIDTVLQA